VDSLTSVLMFLVSERNCARNLPSCTGSDESHEIAHVFQVPDLRSVKPDFKRFLDRKNKANVREAVPAIDVLGRQLRSDLDGLVIENFVKYTSQS
jgi:hypothetical protein